MTISSQILADAEILWRYHRLDMPLTHADFIIGLGSYDLRVAEYASDLFNDGWGDMLIFTGALVSRTDLLMTTWTRPEAEVFGDVALRKGVPRDRLLLETRATNTGENLTLSWQLITGLDRRPERLLVVTKPNMERRARATARVTIPAGVEVMVTSPPSTFEDECLTRNEPYAFINLLVGDLQRIELYPSLGFQARETLPDHVKSAALRLVAAGFVKHLVASC